MSEQQALRFGPGMVEIENLPEPPPPPAPPPPPEATSVVVEGASVTGECEVREDPPTHSLHRADGSVEIVHAQGHAEGADLRPLPADFWDGAPRSWRGGVWIADWSQVDARLHGRIDVEAGTVRTRFITDVPGQQLTYQRKEMEARAWIEAESPDPEDFPFLTAEAGATGTQAGVVAAQVLAAAASWGRIGSAIEGARIAAKRAVREATTLAAKEAAAAVDWDSMLAEVAAP
jgi:hypothetical protein